MFALHLYLADYTRREDLPSATNCSWSLLVCALFVVARMISALHKPRRTHHPDLQRVLDKAEQVKGSVETIIQH
jgi:hypothetical protein